MTSATRLLRFYKNDVSRSYVNPMRRWVYHYLFGGALLGGGLYVYGQYQYAAWEATRYPERGDRLCSPSMLEMLLLLPLNYLSYAFGCLSESDYLPESFHRFFIGAIVWWYAIDLSEGKKEEFSTLQEFFVREWKQELRPIAPTPVTSPSDGIVLSVQEDIVDDQLVQVKGMTYSIRRLLHRDMSPVENGEKRIAIALHLRTQDYHHVISPCSFNCSEVVYIPGGLLPNTPAGYHWIPSLLPLNERVVLLGRTNNVSTSSSSSSSSSNSARDGKDSKNSNSNNNNNKNNTNIGMALVGGTLTGRIMLHFDGRVQTNFLNPPEYAVHRRYSTEPLFQKGDPLSTFYWGSSVVLVMDVPKHASLAVKAGDVVKAGGTLITY
ncbi:putative phosphatidylserine decarboxylase [Trypanosoma theileri]|uniref:Putative phosphatidylserine decarboxylase n=1 Tax=Trypanosoma theileri TaxID=67003 RepID=A0A1X0P613_9TRYP|nr:putative phosphatidylserine decarboxylase [Trypanosoma theileri]ORC91999.1 putative phosphatidylserine decarboxylase [Trypanosoma theileri]